MYKPYLIQKVKRREFQPYDETKGIDYNFIMNYMGSAEYEFGALPKSFKRIIKQLNTYTTTKLNLKDFKDRSLRLYHPEGFNTDEYLKYLNGIIDHSVMLKENIKLKTIVTGINEYNPQRPIDWEYESDIFWDIENDVWFTFDKIKMKQIIKCIFNVANNSKHEK